MNTKTMRLPPRRVLTSNNNKRKDREGFDSLKPTPQQSPAPPPTLPELTTTTQLLGSAKLSERASLPLSSSSDHLLAGYLAHEFLTKGTLFGQLWDPARAEGSNGRGSESNTDSNRKTELSQRGKEAEQNQRYVEVSRLLKVEEGAHLPGIFNPSQLARFLQM